MLTPCRARVLSLSLDYNRITWEVAATTEDVYDYTFQVLRSESVEGPYSEISAPLVDTYAFVDNLVKVGDIYRQYHYKLLVRRIADGTSAEYGPYQRSPEPTLIATTLREHMNILMKEFIGRRAWVFPVRTFGQRCANCWNPRLQQRTMSGCRTCFDTGFVRGYHRPIEIYLSVDPTPANQQPSGLGRLQQQSTTARMSSYPPLKPKDVIVEAENIRWHVRTVSTTEEQRTPITQELQLRRIETSDVEYLLTLDLGGPMENLTYTAARNYTNPQTLSAASTQRLEDLDYSAIYALYTRGTLPR